MIHGVVFIYAMLQFLGRAFRHVVGFKLLKNLGGRLITTLPVAVDWVTSVKYPGLPPIRHVDVRMVWLVADLPETKSILFVQRGDLWTIRVMLLSISVGLFEFWRRRFI